MMSKKELTSTARKRIMSDVKRINEDPAYAANGIFISETSEITTWYALVVGPDDSVYTGGFFFFKIEFPHNYPFDPPRVKFLTRAPGREQIRFHPNLYVEGKVCLSILNTWQGPAWSATQSLSTVLMTIQSIMDNHPLKCEPSFYDASNTQVSVKEYSRAIEYENLRTLLHYKEQIGNYPDLVVFKPVVLEHFAKEYPKYLERIDQLIKSHGSKNIIHIRTYGFTTTTDYDSLKVHFTNSERSIAGSE